MERTKLRHMTRKDAAFEIALRAIGTIIFLVIAYPLYFVIIASISNPALVINGGVWLWPRGLTFEGYRVLLDEGRIWVGYRNTVAYAVVGTAISMLVTVPAAYAVSRPDFKARRPAMLFFLFTMYFSGGLIPTYLIITKTLRMDNSFWVMVIPFCLNVYNMIIVRSYFEHNLPRELWEAAQLDGCSNTRYLLTVALPLSRAVVSVIMLYYVVAKWNEYFMALIYIRNNELVPLQIVLRDILIMNQILARSLTDAGSSEALTRANLIKYTSIIVGSAPMMMLYPFLQKYFEKGIMIGAVKG